MTFKINAKIYGAFGMCDPIILTGSVLFGVILTDDVQRVTILFVSNPKDEPSSLVVWRECQRSLLLRFHEAIDG